MTSNIRVWGIHMGIHVGTAPIDEGYTGIGWVELGDLTPLVQSRETLKDALVETFPDAKKGAIPVWAGVLYRFVNDMQVGDIVIYPSKVDRFVNIGRVCGDYQYVAEDADGYPNRRKVEWLGHFPRNDFRQVALNEIGSILTLFRVRRAVDEFLEKVKLASRSVDAEDDSVEATDDETAIVTVVSQAKEATSDLIINQLYKKFDGYEFEYFVAHLIECMGYTARVTSKSGDGGVDVIAHNDELGFEPPIIKVQCKRIVNQTSESDVNQLLGTLGEGEYALFVNLGSYSRYARVLERNKSKLRLIDGEEVVQLVLEHYADFSPHYRALIPLTQIYIPDL